MTISANTLKSKYQYLYPLTDLALDITIKINQGFTLEQIESQYMLKEENNLKQRDEDIIFAAFKKPFTKEKPIDWSFSETLVENTILNNASFIDSVNYTINELQQADPTIEFRVALELAKLNYLLANSKDENQLRSTLYEIVVKHIQKYLPNFEPLEATEGMEPGSYYHIQLEDDNIQKDIPYSYVEIMDESFVMRDYVTLVKNIHSTLGTDNIWNSSYSFELILALVSIANCKDKTLADGVIYNWIRTQLLQDVVTKELFEEYGNNLSASARIKYEDKLGDKVDEAYLEMLNDKDSLKKNEEEQKETARKMNEADVVATLHMQEMFGKEKDEPIDPEENSDGPGDNFKTLHPAYYNDADITPFEYIRAQNFDFFLGNVIKYISRAGKKDPNKHIEDLEKAKVYLEEEIKHISRRLARRSE